MVIPMAIIYEIAFFRIDNWATLSHFFSAMKKFLQKVVNQCGEECLFSTLVDHFLDKPSDKRVKVTQSWLNLVQMTIEK